MTEPPVGHLQDVVLGGQPVRQVHGPERSHRIPEEIAHAPELQVDGDAGRADDDAVVHDRGDRVLVDDSEQSEHVVERGRSTIQIVHEEVLQQLSGEAVETLGAHAGHRVGEAAERGHRARHRVERSGEVGETLRRCLGPLANGAHGPREGGHVVHERCRVRAEHALELPSQRPDEREGRFRALCRHHQWLEEERQLGEELLLGVVAHCAAPGSQAGLGLKNRGWSCSPSCTGC